MTYENELAWGLIRKHEGCGLHVYRDTRGIPTIGYGLNLTTPWAKQIIRDLGLDYDALLNGTAVLTVAQAEQIFAQQYAKVRSQARVTFPDLDTMPEEAAAVIVDMIFNLGYAAFLLFRRFIEAMKMGRWAVAIQEMEESLWAKQVPNRVKDDVSMMEQIGVEPILKG